MERKADRAYKTSGAVFASRLTKIMGDRGLNQTHLQAKIFEQSGKTLQRQTISLYMNGQSKPDTERLTLICRALDVSADYLLGISEQESIDPEINAICKYTGLSKDGVDAIHTETLIGDPPGYPSFIDRLITDILMIGGGLTGVTFDAFVDILHSAAALEMEARSEGNYREDLVYNVMHSLQGKNCFVLDAKTAAEFYLSKAQDLLTKQIREVLKSMRDDRFKWLIESYGDTPVEEFDWNFVYNEEADNGEHQED